MVKPQGAFYLFPKSPLEDDAAFVDALQEWNVLVVPGQGIRHPGPLPHLLLAWTTGCWKAP